MSFVRKPFNFNSRWESSKKSLTVKTVWVNGNRHVILYHEDPFDDYIKGTTKSRSRVNSSVNQNYIKSSPTGNCVTSDYFQISPMKPLLEDVKNIKTRSRQSSRKVQSSKVKTVSFNASDSAKLQHNNMNADFIMTQNENFNKAQINLLKAFRVSRLSTSVEIDYKTNSNDSDHHHTSNLLISKQCCQNFCNNSISNQVLMWLDLATQTNENLKSNWPLKSFKGKNNRSFEFNAESPEVQGEALPINWKSTECEEIGENIFVAAEGREESEIDVKDDSLCTEDPVYLKCTEMVSKNKILNNFASNSNKYNIRSKYVNLPITSHKEECQFAVTSDQINIKMQSNEIFKRQLHIFMPNIPVKKDDGSSILSSKCSSLLIKTTL